MLVKKQATIDVVEKIEFSPDFGYGRDFLLDDFKIPYRCIWEFSKKDTGEFVGLLVFNDLEEIDSKITVDIFFVYVHIDLRKKGFAKQIIEALKEYLHTNNGSRIILEVAENNLSGLALYNSLGFKQSRIRRNYYKGKINAIEMYLDV